MAWILHDFECVACGHKYEELVDSKDRYSLCPECHLGPNEPVISATPAATYSLMSKDDKAKHLRKRSREHGIKQMKKDPSQAMTTKKRLKLR